MKFAKYWKKEEIDLPDNRFGSGPLSVWGASNESESEAQQQAKTRARQLLDFFNGGFKNNDYEYWNGFIREEVLEEIQSDYGETLAVITRNHYGALVLNTESVLFGDIDIPNENVFSRLMQLFGAKKKDKSFFLEEIKQFQIKNPELSFIVYETFAGLRFVISNKKIQPEDDIVKTLFKELTVDRLYTRLCKNQLCFRARLTPKPWRIGIDRPSSRFPRNRTQDNEFRDWLYNYERASRNKNAAKKLQSFGSASTLSDIQQIIDIHDRFACNTMGELA